MIRILHGDCRSVLAGMAAESVHMVCTSPPYWGLRDYGESGQIGLEPTPQAYVETMVAVFREVRRALRADGTVWLNLGDCYQSGSRGGYDRTRAGVKKNAGNTASDFRGAPNRLPQAGLKDKDLVGIPWMVAFALRADGWWLRSDIVWAKSNAMPESVQGSHFSRHMVTIADYERLSGLPYVDECAGDAWAGDMPSLSAIEVSRGKAPLSADGEGQGNGAETRGTRGRAGEATGIQSVAAGKEQQSEVRSYQEGQGSAPPALAQISRKRKGHIGGGLEASTHQERTEAAQTTPGSEPALSGDGKGQGSGSATARQAQGSGFLDERADNGSGLGCHYSGSQRTLLLLPENDETNARPCNSSNQGRAAYKDERGSSVPRMQFKEGQPSDPALLVGCPGCESCSKYHGYLFHMSAGRPTRSHEYVFLLSKAATYWYDAGAVAEPARGHWSFGQKQRKQRVLASGGALSGGTGDVVSDGISRNLRDVWTIATAASKEAHYAVMPEALAELCIKAGCPAGGTVLDPFAGSGTTGLVADRLGRDAILIDLNPANVRMAERRLHADAPLFSPVLRTK